MRTSTLNPFRRLVTRTIVPKGRCRCAAVNRRGLNRSASGERFNPRLLTAAHRHLPFGTIVRVTNRLNGLSVEVRINDRGPYSDDDRIIDVSSAAADVLKMKKEGIVPVEVEVIEFHQ